MGHKPAAVMCKAVNTTWRNTGVTPADIGRVFYRQPCLTCILAKRNRDSKLIWARKRPPPQPPPDEQQPPIDTALAATASDTTETDCEIGEVISYDNVGPINPASLEGYTQFLAFRDTKSKYIFTYPIKTCNEDTFLYYLDKVITFFKNRGITPRILRSDYYTTFRSAKVTEYYESKGCTHQSSAPYQQWQNSGHTIHRTPRRPIQDHRAKRIRTTALTQQPSPRLPTPLLRQQTTPPRPANRTPEAGSIHRRIR
jgi:hypothetical protein